MKIISEDVEEIFEEIVKQRQFDETEGLRLLGEATPPLLGICR
jgi:hypothetical protein